MSRDEIVVVTDTAVVDLEDLRRLVPGRGTVAWVAAGLSGASALVILVPI